MLALAGTLASRPVCPDVEPECFVLPFCDAVRCAVDLRRGLTGQLAHCPVTGVKAVAGYASGGRRAGRAA